MHELEHHINTVLSKSMVCLYKYKSCGCRIPFYHNIHFTLHNNLVTYTYLFYLHIYLLTISFIYYYLFHSIHFLLPNRFTDLLIDYLQLFALHIYNFFLNSLLIYLYTLTSLPLLPCLYFI